MSLSLTKFTKKLNSKSLTKFLLPLIKGLKEIEEIKSTSNKPIEFSFDKQIKSLVYYHLNDYKSGREFLQATHESSLVKEVVSCDGISKSTFFDAISSRGVEQLIELFTFLKQYAQTILPRQYKELGQLVPIDGSFIEATLSMHWADYRKKSNKAKVHFGLNLNQGIPKKLFLTTGKSDERPFVSKILDQGETGILDRYYQKHQCFDQWSKEGLFYVCRIKENTQFEIIQENTLKTSKLIMKDAKVILGSLDSNKTTEPVRLIIYKVDGTTYYVATNRFDLTAEKIALIYKLRWQVEKFFAWWKRHLKVYHLLSRSEHGLLVQILSGLITYFLFSIYCNNCFKEKVSIRRIRQLRNHILNELMSVSDENQIEAKVPI